MKKYFDIPVRDNHMHPWKELPIEESIKYQKDILEKFNYKSITLLSINEEVGKCPHAALMDNLKNIYIKHKLYPNIFAYAGLHLGPPNSEVDENEYLEQAKIYHMAGYDGIKMFYNSGNYEAGYPWLSSKAYVKFFDYMEKAAFPIIIHLGGPEALWKKENVPESQKHWLKKELRIHLYDMFKDFTTVMEKHPKLKIVLAHFGFITEHIDWAEEWLEKYENLYFDLTPSLFMYLDFQKNSVRWKEFFNKFQDRIIYGTDMGSNAEDFDNLEPEALYHVVRGFFEEKEPFTEFGETFYPINLTEDILKKIYNDNMLKLYPDDKPAKINKDYLKYEFEREEENSKVNQLARENYKIMKRELINI